VRFTRDRERGHSVSLGNLTETDGPVGVSIRDLRVEVAWSHEVVLDGVSLEVAPGEIVGIAGETGSGKSTLGLALLGHCEPGLVLTGGSVSMGSTVISGSSPRTLQDLRGRDVSYVPQDPARALNPGLRVGDQFREVMRAHGVRARAKQEERISELLDAVGLTSDRSIRRRFPHQLSGGQQQRITIATAFLLHPRLVVMDEPTTGLDVSTKRGVIELVRRLSEDQGTSIVFISHDLQLLLSFVDRIAIMYRGQFLEQGTVADVVGSPRSGYTKALLGALPKTPRTIRDDITSLRSEFIEELRVEGLSARHGDAVVTHDITFAVERGRCLALVGESGSGKTTIARCIVGLHAQYEGRILLEERLLARDVGRRPQPDMAAIQYVFQNPYGSLNPRRSVGASIALVARWLRELGRREADTEALRYAELVGLRSDQLGVLPHELSGGQRQRAALARALIAQPQLLICDEVTSSLDVLVQRGIIELLMSIQAKSDLSMLFITHDLALARAISDRTLVLHRGAAVEEGSTEQILSQPEHAYTRSLIAALDDVRTTPIGSARQS
jgi:peptide/nickel transport system ATP-binding protein